MKHPRKVALFAGCLITSLAAGSPTISQTSVRAYHKAIDEANSGQLKMAEATLNCLIMPQKVTVGVFGPYVKNSGSSEGAIIRSLQVWSHQLSETPFVFSRTADPELKIIFVTDIKRGRDVQGQVHFERQVFSGRSGTGYRIKGTVYVKDNVNGRMLNSAEAASVIEHELGHVLGLDDDSTLGHLMGPFVPGSPVDGPRPDEVYTLTTFRSAVQDVIHQIRSHRGYSAERFRVYSQSGR